MNIHKDLSYNHIDDLYLDPMNPRLGRHRMSLDTSQDELLKIMHEWVLDELALSYLESGGFWSYEPLIVINDSLYGTKCLIVVEGNRRLAALKTLKMVSEGAGGDISPQKWESMLADREIPEGLFEQIPCVEVDSREAVQAFLGFRHVTGIKQWAANEKADFIVKMIDDSGYTDKQVAQNIGSKTPTVRRIYIAHKTLLQIEKNVESFEAELAQKRFAILYMTLSTIGAQKYLQVDLESPPGSNFKPIPEDHMENLAHFSKWIFGTSNIPNIVTDTRQVSDFGKILESQEAVEYLTETKEPKFEVAFRIAGGDEEETINYIRQASNNVELALMRAHAFKGSHDLQIEVERLGEDVRQILDIFPEIKAKIFGKDVS